MEFERAQVVYKELQVAKLGHSWQVSVPLMNE